MEARASVSDLCKKTFNRLRANVKLGIHEKERLSYLSQQLVSIPLIPVEKFRQVIRGRSKVYFDAPCLRRFKVQDLLPPTHRLLPYKGDFHIYFQNDLVSSRGPNIGSCFVFPLYSQGGLKRPSSHFNLILNYSELQHFQFSAPNFTGFPYRRKTFPSRVPNIVELNNSECPALEAFYVSHKVSREFLTMEVNNRVCERKRAT
ncbi:hypothetical protein AVEN_83187-1 [Araneus ventricosus]|uniref:Uncharacterized protein n=1 Tax=Araneus ventricosus TaxID=182803 RepID=A0A4Y2AN24_ARAVE|nr:hypothetical protein AVEN_83187-1 [Araneus ventricosus]